MLSRIFFIAVVGLALAPAPASAQMINASVTEFTGRTSDELDDPIGTTECDGSHSVTILVTNIPTGVTHLDLWRGSSCNDVMRRDGGDDDCTRIAFVEPTVTPPMREIELVPVNMLVDCTASGDQVIYILGGDSSPETGDVGTSWGTLELTVDFTAPAAPGGLEGGMGDTAIPVDWDGGSETDIREYRIWFAAGCPSTELVAGATAPTRAPDRTVAGSTTTTDFSGEDLGLAYGEQATIAVAAEDTAGNVSTLSVTCVTRVQTTGFWDRTGNEPAHCSVGAAGAEGASGWLLGLGVALATMLALRGRRRR